DLMPTILESVGVEHPGTSFEGREILPMQGASMWATVTGSANQVHGPDYYIAWDLAGKQAVRQQDWKIIRENSSVWWWDVDSLGIVADDWQLYNVADDPAELSDLSASDPARRSQLIELWDVYAEQNGVVLPDQVRGY
ncbi:MAG: hypothetical protein ACR2QQ_06800, partial [Gammaproteobacteria bacterium]